MQATVQERKRDAVPTQPNQPPASAWRKAAAFRPEEGWVTYILLGFVLYSAVWSIQAVRWVSGLGILTWTTAVGLVLGLIAAKQQRMPRLLMHAFMMAVGIFFAFWQTANVTVFDGDIRGLWDHFVFWLEKAVTPNADTNDDMMFLLFLAVLSFILAYMSVWLVARTRRPWLVMMATAIVLLINLSYAPEGNLIYLTIFLLAALLLLVRANLSEAYRQWRRRSLRYTADLGWDFMVAGMLFSVGVLVLGWILPSAGVNPAAASAWSTLSNPWVSAQQLWARLFHVSGGPGSGAYFSNRLELTGSVDLPNVTILTFTSREPDQYLIAVTQDYFDGHGWSSTNSGTRNFNANDALADNKSLYSEVQQNVHLVNPPGGSPYQYIFAAADPVSFSVPVVATQDSSGLTSWSSRDPLVPGENYTAISFVSTADENTLRQVPLPTAAEASNPLSNSYYPPDVVNRYTQIPSDLVANQQVRALADKWTSGQTNMYDMAVSLENHLRSAYKYNQHNDNPPPDQDAVAWFLLQEKQGFCTFFASAMAMLARMEGIPARVASGYTNGTADQNGHQVVKGTDAHTWVQIYFPPYGWINFDPSPGFTVSRPLPSITPGSTNTPTSNAPQPTQTPKRPIEPGGSVGPNTTSPSQQGAQQVRLLLGAGGLLALFILILGGTSLWWRRLFRGLSPVAQTFGRVTLLASWAGLKPKPAQTPFEYVEALQQRLPGQAEPLQRLGELYVYERWGAPDEGSGVREELGQLWMRLRGGLVRAVARRPSLNPLAWLRMLEARHRRR
jgi:transglutaminase-like putative cysteine protease